MGKLIFLTTLFLSLNSWGISQAKSKSTKKINAEELFNKKNEGCSKEDELKKKLEEAQKQQKAVSLQGAGSDCTTGSASSASPAQKR